MDKMYSIKVKGIYTVKGHAVPVEYAAGWDAALDAVQAARAQTAGEAVACKHSEDGKHSQHYYDGDMCFHCNQSIETQEHAKAIVAQAAMEGVVETIALLEKHQKWINNLPIPTTGATHQMVNVIGKAIDLLRHTPPAQVPDAVALDAANYQWLLKNCIQEDENGYAVLHFETSRHLKTHSDICEWLDGDIDGARLASAPQPKGGE